MLVISSVNRIHEPGMGEGTIPYSHPLTLGDSASLETIYNELSNADVVPGVATEFGETDYHYFFREPLKLKGKLIRIDIDASQLTRNVRSDIAICCDAKLALTALVDGIKQSKNHPQFSTETSPGQKRAKSVRTNLQSSANPDFAAFFKTLRSALPEVVIAGDSTQPTYQAWLQYETEKPRTYYFHSASGFGTLGYTIPAAIGAKLAMPESPVIGLIGDGASQFTIGELASAVETGLSVIFLIWNNSGYREIKKFMIDGNIPPIGVDIHTPNFQIIARGFGCHTALPRTLEQLETELIKANSQKRPTLIEVCEDDFLK